MLLELMGFHVAILPTRYMKGVTLNEVACRLNELPDASDAD